MKDLILKKSITWRSITLTLNPSSTQIQARSSDNGSKAQLATTHITVCCSIHSLFLGNLDNVCSIRLVLRRELVLTEDPCLKCFLSQREKAVISGGCMLHVMC